MTLAWLAFVPWAVALAHVDLDVRRLPNKLVMPAWWVAPLVVAAGTWPWGDTGAVVRAVICGALAFAALFVLAIVPGAQLGFGDVKVIFPCAVLLGWKGAGEAFNGVCYGFFLAGGYVLVMMLLRRAGRKSTLALGPWLLAGSLLAALTGGAP